MKQPTPPENLSIDSLQMPAKSTISIFGRVIPVTDYVTVGEAIELEALLNRTDLNGIQQNLESLAIMIRHRTGEIVSASDLGKQPLPDIAAFEEAVSTLILPFATAYRAAEAARAATLKEGILSALKLIGAASKAN